MEGSRDPDTKQSRVSRIHLSSCHRVRQSIYLLPSYYILQVCVQERMFMQQNFRRLQRSMPVHTNAETCFHRRNNFRLMTTQTSHDGSTQLHAHTAVDTKKRKLGRLVLVRHGESIWNVTDPTRDISPRFSGWANIPLTPRGVQQAKEAGKCLHQHGYHFGMILTSVLKRR